MSTSGGERARGQIGLANPVADRRLEGERNLLLVLEPHEVAEFLHRLLAVLFGIEDLLAVTGKGQSVSVKLGGISSGRGRAHVDASDDQWVVELSRPELEYWCRFLTEAVLGTAAADHIDLEDADAPDQSVTLRIAETVVTLGDAEARRRLGS